MGQDVSDGPAGERGRRGHRAVVQPLGGTDQALGGLVDIGHQHKRVNRHETTLVGGPGAGATEFAFVAVAASVPSVQTRQTIAEGVGIVLFVVRAFRLRPEAAA
ncbi:hypothetical protein Aau02nite_72290 [Amorphoplanes auranticolor]|uniref:Uncharacterized protein n=1 Tax=Actinoplanes auranticolor TaxID=47988 RepID=A0A919SRP8_9ACTN|nr:hypothetical protein Aau02nite_72290 [Actinoplanes auranticolor]